MSLTTHEEISRRALRLPPLHREASRVPRPVARRPREVIPFQTIPRPPIPFGASLKGTDKEFIKAIEIFVRGQMPAAFNQYEDLNRDPQTLYRWERTKGGIQYLIDKGHTIGKSISQIRSGSGSSSMQDVVMLGRAALTFGGGACNDYSAASALAYMGSNAMDPITRFWAPGMGHSFDVVGDIRTPEARVLDSWVTERNPHGFWGTQLPLEELKVINEWKPRAREEGEQLYLDYMKGVNERAFYHSADSVSQSALEVKQRKRLTAYAGSSSAERRTFHWYVHPNHEFWTGPQRTSINDTYRNACSNPSALLWNVRRSTILH